MLIWCCGHYQRSRALIRKYKKKNIYIYIYIYIVDISVENYIENILSSPGLSVRAAVQQHKGERE